MINYIATLLTWSYLTATAQNSIDSIFAYVPSEILPMIEKNERLDLLDLYNSQMEAKTENIFGSTATMLMKSPTQVLLQLTSVSKWQLKMLKTGKDTIYSCIHSIETAGGQSHLSFYDQNWKKIETVALPSPEKEEFINRQLITDETNDSIASRLYLAHIQATWVGDNTQDILKLELIIDGHNTSEKNLRKHLRPLFFIWKQGTFIERQVQTEPSSSTSAI